MALYQMRPPDRRTRGVPPDSLCHSIAVGADTDAHAGSSEADTAPVFVVTPILPALDITLTRCVSIGITGLADDDTAFSAFAPAAAVFVADHANVLNVARRYDRHIGGKRRSGSHGREKRSCPDCQRDPETVHTISPIVFVSGS